MGADEHSDRPPPDVPRSLRVAMAAGVRRLPGTDGTTVLLGGSPLRLLRLRPKAVAVLDRLLAGEPVGDRPPVSRLARRLLDAGLVAPVIGSGFGPGTAPEGPGTAPEGPGAAAVTLVIPVKDRRAELAALLDALSAMPAAERPAAIVVVDDGSADGSGDVATERGATVVRHRTARGPAAARNAGLEAVGTELVAFVDSDCMPTQGWLGPLLAHLADPAVVLCAPRIVAAADAQRTVLERYEAVRSPLDLGPVGGYVRPRTRLAYVPAAALVGRVEVLRGVGGFDTALHVGEDVDLVWRLEAAGHRIRYEPASRVVHRHRTQLAGLLRRRAQYGTSAALLDRRHPGQVPPLAMSGWSAAAWTAGAVGGVPGAAVGVAVAVGTAALLPRKLAVLERPWPVSMDLALRGHLGAGRLLGSAVWRSWLPPALLAAAVSRRARVALVAGGVLPALADWGRSRPPLDPVTYTALRLADDAAYCAGVWHGCIAERSWGALRPELRDWPGRRRPDEDAGP